jgi:hypothetical protein
MMISVSGQQSIGRGLAAEDPTYAFKDKSTQLRIIVSIIRGSL